MCVHVCECVCECVCVSVCVHVCVCRGGMGGTCYASAKLYDFIYHFGLSVIQICIFMCTCSRTDIESIHRYTN